MFNKIFYVFTVFANLSICFCMDLNTEEKVKDLLQLKARLKEIAFGWKCEQNLDD
ncbi:MAG: hypothetical protein ACTSXG_04345 [Alphaproteobacteria bacterium]